MIDYIAGFNWLLPNMFDRFIIKLMKICRPFLLLALLLLAQSIQIQVDQELKEVNVQGLLKLKDIVRSIDGSGNNLKQTNWGKSMTNILRRTPARYEDGKS